MISFVPRFNALKCWSYIRFFLSGGVLISLLGCWDSSERVQQGQPVPQIAVKTKEFIPTPDSISKLGPQYRVLSKTLTKPDCAGENCPSMTFKRLDFEAYPRFNAFLVRSQLEIALMDVGHDKKFQSLGDLANAFWQTAEDRYELVLSADVVRDTSSIVVTELHSYVYAGGAHGMSTAMYINWSPALDQIFTLNDFVLPGRMKAFEEALKKQHAQWLKDNEFAQADPSAYLETWPFQFSDNAALMQDGIAVTFGHYILGPYALGMPTILIPFSELKGILNKGLLKKIHAQG
jgi:hypothetical protein